MVFVSIAGVFRDDRGDCDRGRIIFYETENARGDHWRWFDGPEAASAFGRRFALEDSPAQAELTAFADLQGTRCWTGSGEFRRCDC